MNQVLNLRGIFDTVGQYTVTFKLIDRDNSDTVIAANSFTINVEDKNNESKNSNKKKKDMKKDKNKNDGK